MFYIDICILLLKKVSEYNQKIPQSHTADQPTKLCGRATEHRITIHQQVMYNESKATSSPFPIKMIAKLERTLSSAYLNKDKTQDPYKQWEQQ